MYGKMKAAILTGHGGPEKLIIDTVDRPKPTGKQVLLKVLGSSVNNTDINTRTGWYGATDNFQLLLEDKPVECRPEGSFPWGNTSSPSLRFPLIQGCDIFGIVEEVGPLADEFLLGKRALVDPVLHPDLPGEDDGFVGSEIDGGFAEFAVIADTNIYPIQSDLSDCELAAIPCAYSTAQNMLSKAAVSRDDIVLVTGASGGVGAALVQLSKCIGSTIIALVGSGKGEMAKMIGADYVYDRNCDRLSGKLKQHKVTVCVDVVGGEQVNMLMDILEVGGRFCTAGAIAGPLVQLDLRLLIYKDLHMIGATRQDKSIFDQLVSRVESRMLKPIIAKTFPLSQIHQAQKFFQLKQHFGKVVILP